MVPETGIDRALKSGPVKHMFVAISLVITFRAGADCCYFYLKASTGVPKMWACLAPIAHNINNLYARVTGPSRPGLFNLLGPPQGPGVLAAP